ncbi:MAG TPA: hypothetical protein VNM69_01775 [Bacillus sp. (in: firmicutes)]|uniref:hypothetical protein n=1 Tax=Bacillus litorisediminis TaxID=2922713 RepID=UPI001FAC389D|nr:hypothetical protein [Bacillus litorisediminis]HWO74627.1 hypothetical protein [Bacillus sp. (in: firmicutes)]
MNFRDLFNWNGNIYLNTIVESEPCHLTVYVDRCKVSDQSQDLTWGEQVIHDVRPIVVDEGLPILKVDFSTYISYSVLNETYFPFNNYDVFEGSCFKIAKQSRYFEYILSQTMAHHIHPNKQHVHYGIYCLNHIIDVISYEEPLVCEVSRDSF